jgi:D-alanyl-lipoteichoic acid acyltransferase DltB (MBOAT superfamily)
MPWGWLHWILMIYGMLNSIAFLLMNMVEYLDTMDKKGLYIIFGIIGLAQISLFLTFKLVFFDLIYDSDS